MLSKEVSSTIFKVFGMMWPGTVKQYIGAMEEILKKNICPQTFLLQQKLLSQYIIIHTLTSKGHERLTYYHLGNTKTCNCLQQDIKKMPCLSLWETRNHHSPIIKIRNIISMLTQEQTSTFAFRPICLIHFHHHHHHHHTNTTSNTKNHHTPSWIIP